MKDVIMKYKETMDEITVRESFERETVQILQDVDKRRRAQKKIRMRQLEKAAVMCVAILLLGTGSVAAAASLNLGQMLRERFNDDVSAGKIDSGEYQSLDESVSNDDMTVRCIGAVGDEETSFLMLELDIRNDVVARSKEIGLGIKTYDTTVRPENYVETKCRADKVEAGEEISRYMLMYRIPRTWAQLSMNENQEILVDIHTLIRNYGEAEEYINLHGMVMPITLNGTFMESGETLAVNQQTYIAGREVKITEVQMSEYRTEVWVAFPADSFDDAFDYWKSISRDYLFGEDYERIPNPKHIELYHNGKCVEYAEDYLDYCPVYVDADGFSSFSGPGEYCCLVSLKGLDLGDGDSLEVRYDDVVVKVR